MHIMACFPPGHLMSMTPEQLQAWRWEREIDERNRPLTDEELDAMFPEGYKVCRRSFQIVVEVINTIKIITIIIYMFLFWFTTRCCPRQQVMCLFAPLPVN